MLGRENCLACMLLTPDQQQQLFGSGLSIPFILRTLNVLVTLNVLREANFMFVVTDAPFVFLTGQPQKKGVSPVTEKIQIKPVKNASFVDLSPSGPPV